MIDDEPSVFARYVETTEQRAPETVPPINLKLQSAGRLLRWVLDRWDEPTISVKQICVYGPRPRNWTEAVNRAEALAARGWLLPVRGRQHNNKVWRIIRENEHAAQRVNG